MPAGDSYQDHYGVTEIDLSNMSIRTVKAFLDIFDGLVRKASSGLINDELIESTNKSITSKLLAKIKDIIPKLSEDSIPNIEYIPRELRDNLTDDLNKVIISNLEAMLKSIVDLLSDNLPGELSDKIIPNLLNKFIDYSKDQLNIELKKKELKAALKVRKRNNLLVKLRQALLCFLICAVIIFFPVTIFVLDHFSKIKRSGMQTADWLLFVLSLAIFVFASISFGFGIHNLSSGQSYGSTKSPIMKLVYGLMPPVITGELPVMDDLTLTVVLN